MNNDTRVIENLILRDEFDNLASISSGLVQNFKNNTNTFQIRHNDGSCYDVQIKVTESEPWDSEVE